MLVYQGVNHIFVFCSQSVVSLIFDLDHDQSPSFKVSFFALNLFCLVIFGPLL